MVRKATSPVEITWSNLYGACVEHGVKVFAVDSLEHIVEIICPWNEGKAIERTGDPAV